MQLESQLAALISRAPEMWMLGGALLAAVAISFIPMKVPPETGPYDDSFEAPGPFPGDIPYDDSFETLVPGYGDKAYDDSFEALPRHDDGY